MFARRPAYRLAGLATIAMLAAGCAGPQPRASGEAPPAAGASNADPVPAATPVAAAQDARVGPAASGLTARIDTFVEQPRFRHAAWGIHVADLTSGRVLYARNAQRLFVPASNTKLYTAALALDVLGPDARFATRLQTSARRRGSVLAGDLVLRGGGDPSLGNEDVSASTSHWAEDMAAALARRGIRRIDGDLVADITLFHAAPYGHGWEANDLATWYASPVTALSVDGNVMYIAVSRHGTQCCKLHVRPRNLAANLVNLTGDRGMQPNAPLSIVRQPGDHSIRVTGHLRRQRARFARAMPQPPMQALRQLREALARHGVSVAGDLRVRRWPAAPMQGAQQARVLVRVPSPSVRELVHHMLKHSDNLIAQTLLLQVGVATARSGVCADRARPPGTTDGWGLCAMRAMLRRASIGTAAATFSEGSGLSRHDLVTPVATTTLLRWVRRQPFARVFIDALPVAGVDGTLEYRLRHLPAGTEIHGKTGTLSHAYALAGYAIDINGHQLAFALYLNGYQRPRNAAGRSTGPSPAAELDQIADLIVSRQMPSPGHDMASRGSPPVGSSGPGG